MGRFRLVHNLISTLGPTVPGILQATEPVPTGGNVDAADVQRKVRHSLRVVAQQRRTRTVHELWATLCALKRVGWLRFGAVWWAWRVCLRTQLRCLTRGPPPSAAMQLHLLLGGGAGGFRAGQSEMGVQVIESLMKKGFSKEHVQGAVQLTAAAAKADAAEGFNEQKRRYLARALDWLILNLDG
jgi:hypothetical protein